jgi:mycothiol synthase
MTDPDYVIRNYQPADFDTYARLVDCAERTEPTGRCPEAHLIRGKLSRPNYQPDRDLLIAEEGGHIVGYSDITAEINIGRIVIDCFVLPGYWLRSVTTELLGRAEGRGRELGARVAQINVARDNEAASRALSRLGFSLVRQFLMLRLKTDDAHEQHINQPIWQYRHLKRGEEGKLTQLQNRSFTETWGYNPTSVQEIIYSLSLASNSPEDVIVASDGDRLAGYCWTKTCKENTTTKTAQVFMLGVDPDYRGRGIGKGVLLMALRYLRIRGVHIVELTVDSNNQAAYSLYQSVGFRVWTSSLWYEKPIA